jgi:hypothetical protein
MADSSVGLGSLRIAIVSIPRSGNTWLRLVLANALDLVEIAVHNYLEVSEPLPDRCVLQLHWYREPNFQKWLSKRGFIVIVLARHPLDVLISVLQFIRNEPLTSRWLEGNVEIPRSLAGASPVSEAFRDFALGWGSENLLSISYQWWHDKAALRVRYEEFTAKPHVAFPKLMSNFGVEKEGAIDAVNAIDFETLKKAPNRHGWQGRPGLWRKLVAPADALHIYRRHHRVFKTLGYSVIPLPLSRNAVSKNWVKLAGN